MKVDEAPAPFTQSGLYASTTQKVSMGILKLCCALLVFSVIAGCIKKEEIKAPADFAFISPKQGDTLESLAQKYLGSSSLAWRIEEFNGIHQATPGKALVIPLKPFRQGGLTAAGHQLIPALSYHDFSKGRSNKKLTVSASDFEAQMNYLKSENYHVLTPDQLQLYLAFGQVPQKSVIITIDDGWASSYKIAYPILQKYGLNATLFIPTNFIKSSNPRKLSWDQLREMVNDRTIDIQCHSKSHKNLNAWKYGQSVASYIDLVEKEVVNSKKIIFDKLGTTSTSIAYPYGNTNPVAIEIIKQNGYQTAFTANRESNPFFIQNLRLNRSMIYGTFKLDRFIQNLNIFQDDPIDKIEPIDTLQSINEISYQRPADYELKAQWRTALLAWKLRRDWLITHQGDASIYNQLFGMNDNEELIREAENKVRELDAKTKNTAASYFSEAMQSNGSENADGLLLRTLLYNPNHQSALEKLKNNLNKQQLEKYWVKKKDTFKKIALHLYKDKSKSVLIPLFNPYVNSNADLQPGMKLILPSSSAFKIIKVGGNTKCRVVLTKPAIKLAEDYYTQAIDYFSQDEITKSIAKLKTVICLNPKHQQAIEMLDMLENL